MNITELLSRYQEDIAVPIHLIIDEGHGPNTKGKRSTDGSMREWIYNKSVGQKIGMLCYLANQAGIPITHEFLTVDHTDPRISKRAKKEKEIYYRYKKKAIVQGISLHANAFSDPSANGIECLVYPNSKAFVLAHIIQANLVKATGLRDRGVKDRPDLGILRTTKAPWVLVEAGFMTNPKEIELLKSEEFRNLNAFVIFESLLMYMAVCQQESNPLPYQPYKPTNNNNKWNLS